MNWFTKLFKKQYQLSEEELKWNKMWDKWTEEELEQPLSSLLTYVSEIQNGGHLQFFSNLEEYGNNQLKNTLRELKKILPSEHYDNLNKAYKCYQKLDFKPVTSEDYCDVAIEEPLKEFDDFYYEYEEEITSIMKEYSLKIEL